MKLSFYFDTKKNSNYLMLNVSHDGKRFRKNLGIVLPKSYRIKDNRVTKRDDKGNEANVFIETVQVSLMQYYQTFIADGIPIDLEDVKHKLNSLLGNTLNDVTAEEIEKLEPFEAFEKFIKDRETGIELTNNGNKFTHGTIKQYKVTYNYLKKFSEKTKYWITWNRINQTFINLFNQYLIEKELSKNAIGQKFKHLKTFLLWSKNLGYHNQEVKIKVTKEDTDAIYIDLQEQTTMMELSNLSESLEITRDLFILHCQLGLRVSDFFKLQSSNFHIEHKICITTIAKKRNSSSLKIPLNQRAIEILKKYNCNLPFSSQKQYNLLIKEVCRIAGIDKPTHKTITKGGEQITRVFPKYELVSSHTARRSFITNSLILGIKPQTVMRISDHTDHRTFNKYIKLSEADVINEFHKFYN